jgi:hypothetical protein
MKANTKQKNVVHARKSNTKLSESIKRILNDRQPDMTELMLNDIDAFKDSEKQTGANGCTFRLTSSGEYFTTGEGKKRTVQLSFSAKKRLTILTGGSVRIIKKKETLVFGAFSDQDFRRCFDYIKSCGAWITDADNIEEFVVDTNAVNDAMRNGERWDSLHREPAKQSKRSASKSIKISHYEKDLVLKENGNFADKRKAKKYYLSLMQHVITQCRKGGIELTAKLDGSAVLTEV